MLKGVLCFAGFEPGSSVEWMVRRETGRQTVWVLYRASVEYSRHSSPGSAYAAYSVHVPYDNDTEASLSR